MASHSLFDRMFSRDGGQATTEEGLRAAEAKDMEENQAATPLFKDMQRADHEQNTVINIQNQLHGNGTAHSPKPMPVTPPAPAPTAASNDNQYGQDALIAQLEKASADIDGEEVSTTHETISEKTSAKDEALSRLVDDGPTKKQPSLTTRIFTTLAVVAVVGALGYFGGAFLAANVPAIGSAVSGIGGFVGSIGAHATAFLQGAGLLSVSAPAAGLTLGATGGSVALGGGILGAIGATAIAMKSNILQVIGLESAVNPTITGHETTNTLEPNGMDTVDTSIVDMNRSSSMQAKMGSKAAQYATKHDHYATARSGSSSWADRVGNKSAQHASYADTLQEARAMQSELASESSR